MISAAFDIESAETQGEKLTEEGHDGREEEGRCAQEERDRLAVAESRRDCESQRWISW